MKLTLVQAAQILGISAPLLRWWIRHLRVLAFVGRKPATVEIGPVVNRNVFCALADGFATWSASSSPTRTSTARPTTCLLGSQVPEPVEQPVDDQDLLPPRP